MSEVLHKSARLLAIGVLLTLASCRGLSTPDPEPRQIGFSGLQTKSGEADIQSDGIRVHGLIDFNGSSAAVPIIDNKALTYAEGTWSYSPVSYWALDKWHLFCSWYPGSSTPAVSQNKSGGTDFSVNYSVISGTSINPNEFLFWAGACYSSDENKSRSVPIELQHKLSLLNFNVNVSGFDQASTVAIDDVTLTGMYTSGNYIYNIKGTAEPFDISESWATSGAVYTGGVFHSGPKSLNHGTNSGVVSGLLMIPQAVSQSVTLKVEYHVTKGSNKVNYTKYLNLNAANAPAWGIGRRYNYNITFTPNTIVFGDITVKDWFEDVQSIGLIIR